MKTCPSCGTEVPESAARCKDCFHDFSENSGKAKWWIGPLLLLGTLATMAAMGAGVFAYLAGQPVSPPRIVVNEETSSVEFVTQYRTGPKTDRVRFDEIAKLEYVLTATGKHQVVAVTLDAERVVIQETSGESLSSQAEHYARLMEKPLERLDNTHGFHKAAEADKKAAENERK